MSRPASAVGGAVTLLTVKSGSGGSVSGAMDPEVLKAGAVPNGFSSMGLQTLNPHDLTRGPSGSSGGTGAGIAASFAQFGLGTDTGGSVRGPSSANGIVGLKPTVGLINSSARIIENSDSRRVLKQHRPIVSAEFTGMASKRGDFYRLGLPSP